MPKAINVSERIARIDLVIDIYWRVGLAPKALLPVSFKPIFFFPSLPIYLKFGQVA
jgi:hypothetical protein